MSPGFSSCKAMPKSSCFSELRLLIETLESGLIIIPHFVFSYLVEFLTFQSFLIFKSEPRIQDILVRGICMLNLNMELERKFLIFKI